VHPLRQSGLLGLPDPLHPLHQSGLLLPLHPLRQSDLLDPPDLLLPLRQWGLLGLPLPLRPLHQSGLLGPLRPSALLLRLAQRGRWRPLAQSASKVDRWWEYCPRSRWQNFGMSNPGKTRRPLSCK
jgi:hypothetical protein